METEIVACQKIDVHEKIFFSGELVERFIRFAGVSEKSALTYKIAFRQLHRYFQACDISVPIRADIENWRDKLISEKKSPSTVQLYLTSVKIFFRWLNQEQIYPNIADHLKSRVKISHEHKKDALTAAQAGNLLKSVKGDDVKAKRNRAILALMMTAGLRTIEVSRADCGDMINQFGKTYLLIQGKGRSAKDAKVLVPLQVVRLIQEYWKVRGRITAGEPLFISTSNRNRRQRLSTQAISKMVKASLRNVGMNTPRLTAHSLRHTADL